MTSKRMFYLLKTIFKAWKSFAPDILSIMQRVSVPAGNHLSFPHNPFTMLIRCYEQQKSMFGKKKKKKGGGGGGIIKPPPPPPPPPPPHTSTLAGTKSRALYPFLLLGGRANRAQNVLVGHRGRPTR